LAINNQVDRFNLVIDVIDRVPKLGSAAAYVRERMKNAIIENVNYAHEHGIDKDEIVNWKWPF
jgi:xylulose-5-phosphate/fructose-6-phosphate phosphoketolase